jgi:hypothetical protein
MIRLSLLNFLCELLLATRLTLYVKYVLFILIIYFFIFLFFELCVVVKNEVATMAQGSNYIWDIQ